MEWGDRSGPRGCFSWDRRSKGPDHPRWANEDEDASGPPPRKVNSALELYFNSPPCPRKTLQAWFPNLAQAAKKPTRRRARRRTRAGC